MPVDSANAIAATRFPNGRQAFNAASVQLYKERNAEKLEEKLGSFLKQFELDPAKKEDDLKLNGFYYAVAGLFAAEKNYDKIGQQKRANREELVNKFFEETKYDFNALYDTRNKDNPEVFDVITA